MKSRLHTLLLSAVITLAGFSAVTYTSCTEDKCKAIRCANYGVCQEGACLCPTGYEGVQCETKNRDRYLGIWQVTEHGTYSNAAQYPVSIEVGSPTLNDVIIKNFRNSFTQDVSAHILADTLYIPQQTIGNQTIQGIGYLTDSKYYGDHGKLTVHYNVSNGVDPIDDYGLNPGGAVPSVPSEWSK